MPGVRAEKLFLIEGRNRVAARGRSPVVSLSDDQEISLVLLCHKFNRAYRAVEARQHLGV